MGMDYAHAVRHLFEKALFIPHKVHTVRLVS